ncbi:MAG TPA: septum site-determining protein MinD [Clostridiales bacterium]|nr:septum site-determining protein MinD [Clostridiales bacterium]
MGKVIVIASGKGGTGKTTTAAALSSALAARKCRVLCIDADVGLRNMDLSLGLSEMALPDFCDVIEGRLSLEDAAFQHPTVPSLYFLSAPSLMSPEEIDPEKMRELLDSARRSFDYCIIDSPAGIGSGFRLAARFADSAIVVTTSDITSCRDVQRTVMELKALGIEDVSLIVNRIRPRLLKFSNQNIDDIVDTAGARLLGLVPEDRSVILSANKGILLINYTSRGAAAAFSRIAGRLLGERIPAGDIKPIL